MLEFVQGMLAQRGIASVLVRMTGSNQFARHTLTEADAVGAVLVPDGGDEPVAVPWTAITGIMAD